MNMFTRMKKTKSTKVMKRRGQRLVRLLEGLEVELAEDDEDHVHIDCGSVEVVQDGAEGDVERRAGRGKER